MNERSKQVFYITFMSMGQCDHCDKVLKIEDAYLVCDGDGDWYTHGGDCLDAVTSDIKVTELTKVVTDG